MIDLAGQLEVAKAALTIASLSDREHDYRIARFPTVAPSETPIAAVCDVDVRALRSPRLGPDVDVVVLTRLQAQTARNAVMGDSVEHLQDLMTALDEQLGE